jgi:excinuclease UvrABC helicase subunit UvrB
MLNFRDFDKIFNEMFSERMNFGSSFFDDSNWNKKTYKSKDGSFSITYMVPKSEDDELGNLKEKLNLAIEDQNFEEAVELRDKIKSLEVNKKKISELQAKLDESIKNQDFEKSIEYRDQIKSLK